MEDTARWEGSRPQSHLIKALVVRMLKVSLWAEQQGSLTKAQAELEHRVRLEKVGSFQLSVGQLSLPDLSLLP